MNPFVSLERLTQAQAETQNIAALHFGTTRLVRVGNRQFALSLERRRARYPVRLHGQASGEPLQLDLDAQALFPELAWQTLARTGADAHTLIVNAFDDWLCALEGALGMSIDISSVSYDVESEPCACALAITHVRSGRTASVAFRCDGLDRWLRRQPSPQRELVSLARQIVVGVPVCIAGPSLTLPRAQRIRAGDALVLDRRVQFLRIPMRDGAQRILLKPSGEHTVVDRPLIAEESSPRELTSEFIPIDALTFSFDAMLGSLRLSLYELSRLRTGSLVSLQLSTRERDVTLLCQGIPFARGELVDIDDVLAVRISSIVQPIREDVGS